MRQSEQGNEMPLLVRCAEDGTCAHSEGRKIVVYIVGRTDHLHCLVFSSLHIVQYFDDFVTQC